jgi:preprotein translocase subunit SecY
MSPELPRRIAFTLGALLVYRLGTFIPLPGVDLSSWGPVLDANRGGILGMANASAGDAIGRLSIFSLSIAPYLSAAIMIQLVSMVSSRLSGISKRGASGRRTIARCTIGLTLILAAFQAFGVASGLQGIPNLVSNPGGLFLVSTTATLVGGVIFLIWLSEQITAHGIGNGIALLLCAGIVTGVPRAVASTLELGRQGVLSVELISLLAVLWVGLIGLIVFVERARRRVPVEFSQQDLGGRLLRPGPSHLSLKLNSAGLVPAIVAPWIFFLPLLIVELAFGPTPWMTAAAAQIAPGRPAHMILLPFVLVIIALVYTAFVVDPDHAAESLKKYGGAIAGVEPGEPTAAHIDRVVSYTTAVGAAYLAVVFLIPEALIVYANVPYYFGGASALIVVCAVLDIESQVRGKSLTGRGGEYS